MARDGTWTTRREGWHDRGRHSHRYREVVRRFEKGVATWVTYGNRLEEVPSQVEASYPVGEGKEDHQDRGASFQEEENRDQEGRADELQKVAMGLS